MLSGSDSLFTRLKKRKSTMPAKRTYNVRASKDFLVLAGIFFFLCLWAIKDGWDPSDKVLKKHPRIVEIPFETSGSVGEIYVEVGDSISKDKLLAELLKSKMQDDFETSKKEYAVVKEKHSALQDVLIDAKKGGSSLEELTEIKGSVLVEKKAMKIALKKVEEARSMLKNADLLSPTEGKVKEVRASFHRPIEKGEVAFIVDPEDHFYLFNKSLAIFSFLAFWTFLAFHLFAT